MLRRIWSIYSLLNSNEGNLLSNDETSNNDGSGGNDEKKLADKNDISSPTMHLGIWSHGSYIWTIMVRVRGSVRLLVANYSK